MRGSRFLIALLILILGTASMNGISRYTKRDPATDSTADTLESTLTNTRDTLLSQAKNNQYWSGSFESDVSNDAMIMALGRQIGKLTPDLQDSFVQSMLARMLPDQSGWPAYYGGKADLNVTSIALLSLRSIGIGATDPRLALSWKWFQAQGGEKKIPPYAALLLSTLGVLHDVPEISPRIFGLPTNLPVDIDKMGAPRGALIPLVGMDYLATLPDHALIVDQKPVSAWAAEPVEIGTFSKNRPGARGQRNCPLPEETIDLLLTDIKTNPDKYKDCVFYPNQKGKTIFARIGAFVDQAFPNKAAELLDFLLHRTIVGSDVYWAEQAVSWELQAQNQNGSWYGTLFSVLGVRFLQQAQRVGLGDFSSNIDRAWDGVLNWRVKNKDGIPIEQLTFSGVWDTAAILISFSELQGTQWALPPDQLNASLQWLMDHAITSAGTGTQSWSFDETDTSLPDVDDTANVIHALSDYASPADTRAQAAIEQGAAWILAKQNKDGGFPAWVAGASPFISDIVQMSLHIPTIGDLSQADVTGRVLYSFSGANHWLSHDGGEVAQAAQQACKYFQSMPKVNGTSTRLSLGHWMVNYVYSAANVLIGLASADCESAQQQELLHFIVDRQQSDGGWGETKDGYSSNRYVAGPTTLSQTEVALAGLITYYDLNQSNPAVDLRWIQTSIEKGIQFLISKSNGGRNLIESDFTGVLVKGLVYARYDLLPAYTMLNVLGRWKKIQLQYQGNVTH